MALLTLANLAAEVFPQDSQARLKASRLLAKARIRHFPQPDGSARIEVADLDDYFRAGQPDREPPAMRGDWFDDQFLDELAQPMMTKAKAAFEQSLLHLPSPSFTDQNRDTTLTINVTPSDDLTKALDQPIPKANKPRGRAGEIHPPRLQRGLDAVLVQRLRHAARHVIDRDGGKTAGLQTLYASRSNYQHVVNHALHEVFDSALLHAFAQHTNAPDGGAADTAYRLPVSETVTRHRLHELTDAAF